MQRLNYWIMRSIGLKLIVAFSAVLVVGFFGAMEARGAVLHVKHDAVGTNSGETWDNAYTLLQDALGAAVFGDEIWVAGGTYYPTSFYDLPIDNDRNKHFEMKNGVGIYGGFAGIETERDQRDWDTYVTILSGDIGTLGEAIDNCYHVFYNTEGNAAANRIYSESILDGFTITGGNADALMEHSRGGGMYIESKTWPYSSPTIRNVNFIKNKAFTAGAIYNYYSSTTITDCEFIENSATGYGGGIYNAGDPIAKITNCAFINNSAGDTGGGMVNSGHANPLVTNCIFIGNSALRAGGMFNQTYSDAKITNCSFNNNDVRDDGGAMYNDNASPIVKNTIIWGNKATNGEEEVFNSDTGAPTFSHCNIAGSGGSGVGWDDAMGSDGGGNIDADPLFVNADNNNLRLLLGSPSIDTGDNTAVPAGITTDLDGNDRIVGGTVDMGAYEYQSTTPPISFMLDVRSSPFDGVNIGGPMNGVTCYSVMVENGARVILNAPQSCRIEKINYEFVLWYLNGVPQTLRNNRLDFAICGNTVAEAEYCQKK